MKTVIMAVSLELRSAVAPKVQEILTKHGCIIKIRLGLHEMSDNSCEERGLILLQLCGDENEMEKLRNDLLEVDGVEVNSMKI